MCAAALGSLDVLREPAVWVQAWGVNHPLLLDGDGGGQALPEQRDTLLGNMVGLLQGI